MEDYLHRGFHSSVHNRYSYHTYRIGTMYEYAHARTTNDKTRVRERNDFSFVDKQSV